MSRPARLQPTEGELEILKILWDEGPSELKQVCAGLRRNRPVAPGLSGGPVLRS